MRTEKDAIGTVNVPDQAPRGIFTERVLAHYPQKDIEKVPELFYRTFIRIKIVYAQLNAEHGKLDQDKAEAIAQAGKELLALETNKFMEYFPISRIQSGGGTSTHMIVNEVLANKATVILGGQLGEYLVNPHDHVNASQSSNDTFPATTKLTTLQQLAGLEQVATTLQQALAKHAKNFAGIEKAGRTHLQDAVVMTLGEEFGAFARMVEKNICLLAEAKTVIQELNLGGTAIGSLQNITQEMRKDIAPRISKEFKIPLSTPQNFFEQGGNSSDIAHVSQAVTHFANDLIKICNDIRILASGPLAAIHELSLPEIQPGSSIMPGKVNPSMPEALSMICAKVIGNNETIQVLSRMAQLQLQVFSPEIAWSMYDSIHLLSTGIDMFTTQCVTGITANTDRIDYFLKHSFVTATNYSEKYGYEAVAEAVTTALKTGKTLEEVFTEMQLG